jgi:hypothetical protein
MGTTAMPTHIYHVGQTVALNPSQLPDAGVGPYAILRLLPGEGRNFGYRIQHHVDGHERVVQQSEISGETAPALMWPSSPLSSRKAAAKMPSGRSRTLPRF